MLNKRILVFAHDSSLYGASQSLLSLLIYITKNTNANVLVLLPYKGPIEEQFKNSNIKYQVVDFPRCVVKKANHIGLNKVKNNLSYYYRLFKSQSRLKKITDSFNSDIIYTNTSVVSAGYLLSQKLKLPHVWHVREFGDLDYNFEFIPSQQKIASYIQQSDRVMFVSKALHTHWTNSSNEKYSVVYNGVIESNQDQYISRNFPADKFTFGILGAVLPGKGQDIAIKAIIDIAKRHPSVKLLIYGNIADREYYSTLKDVAGVNAAVEFRSFTDDKNSIYNNLDVLLNCSAMEGFGRTIIEAMERGIPVIANASAGPLEIIGHKIDGLLYHQSTKSLIENIEWLFANKEEYEKISRNSIKKANEKYTIESYANSVINVLDKAKEN